MLLNMTKQVNAKVVVEILIGNAIFVADEKSCYIRVRAHLLKLPGYALGSCTKVTSKEIAQMPKLEDEAKERAKCERTKESSLATLVKYVLIGS